MKFPKEFFEGEEREGFFVSPMMKKVWAAQLEVVEDISKVCKKHNIQFFADCGTLLGAIRHKGFVPWDDDIDLAMKRQDYQKFIEVANELPEGYKVINFHTEPEYDEMITRVVNDDKISFEPEKLEKFHGCPYAVGIDIFVWDYMPVNPKEDELIDSLLKCVLDLAADIQTNAISQDEMIYLLNQIGEMCCVKFDMNKPIHRQLMMLAEQLCMMYKEEEAVEITDYIKKTQKKTLHMSKLCFESCIEVPFECTTIPVPIGYDTVLKKRYGKKYMTPVIRTGHNYPFYKEQEKVVKEVYGFIPE